MFWGDVTHLSWPALEQSGQIAEGPGGICLLSAGSRGLQGNLVFSLNLAFRQLSTGVVSNLKIFMGFIGV